MTGLPAENVQDYPRPPALEAVPQTLRVMLGGETVAESARCLRVLETHHAPTYYFPAEDVVAKLTSSAGSTFCEWKGHAAYFDVESGGAMAKRAAWAYPKPTAKFRDLTDYVSFYAGAMEACFVGEERVIPQPGDFYGGWVTRNLQGQVKGAAGTEFW
ncbi:MAG: DUF427 domain-containing protein [Pseudomonadota bacterium]